MRDIYVPPARVATKRKQTATYGFGAGVSPRWPIFRSTLTCTASIDGAECPLGVDSVEKLAS